MFMLEHRDQSYDVVTSNTTGPGTTTTYSFRDQSNAPNAFLGVGGRATSKSDFVRFTFGLTPGLAIRTFSPSRKNDGGSSSPPPNDNPGGGSNRFVPSGTTTNGITGCQNNCGTNNDQDFGGTGYTTFAFLADGGILLGSTPGTKFYIGANVWVDFGSTLTVGPDTKTPIPDNAFAAPGRGVRVNQAVQFYVGPTIGLQFGH